jgi:hypothetical protein
MSEAAARLLADGRRYDSILATTSHCGREPHEWAANKPLTLIDGPNLLALLTKHGYNFKIEAGT